MKNIEIPAVVTYIAISVAFAVICVLVYFSFGKSAKLVKAKLKLGAVLLTLNSIIACNDTPPPHTCYDVAMVNQLYLNTATGQVNEQGQFVYWINDTIDGQIQGASENEYSFCIKQNDNVLVKDFLMKVDSTTNYSEYFTLPLKKRLDTGSYQLYFYRLDKTKQADSLLIDKKDILITAKK